MILHVSSLYIYTCMTTKLTLTLDNKVIDSAKIYAKKSGKSLSNIVENYLQSISSKEEKEEISPKIQKLMGSVKLPKNFDYKKELAGAISKKYQK